MVGTTRAVPVGAVEIARYYFDIQAGALALGRIMSGGIWQPYKAERAICCARVKNPAEWLPHVKSLAHVLARYAGGTNNELAVEVRLEIEQQRTVRKVVARLKGEQPATWDEVQEMLPLGEIGSLDAPHWVKTGDVRRLR